MREHLGTNEMNDRPMILVSDLAARRKIHFLKVRLIGTASNRDGLGATVRVVAGGRTYTHYRDGKSGYLRKARSRFTSAWAMPTPSALKCSGPPVGNKSSPKIFPATDCSLYASRRNEVGC